MADPEKSKHEMSLLIPSISIIKPTIKYLPRKEDEGGSSMEVGDSSDRFEFIFNFHMGHCLCFA